MKLDFRTKFFMTITISTVCITGILQQKFPYISYAVISLPFLLLLLEKKYKMVIKGFIFMIIAILLSRFVLHHYGGIIGTIALIITCAVLYMLPGLMMGYYSLITTSMNDLVESLKKMKLPDIIVVPISVMFRFAYSTAEDYHIVNDAMFMHGLTLRHAIKEPLRILEYKLVPLLMVVTKTADDVSISAMTRGMKIGLPRTSISQTKLNAQDYFFILLMIGILYVFVRSLYA